jgi:hypothetical protein
MRLMQLSSSLGTNTSQFARSIASGLFSILLASCGGGGGGGSPSPPPVVNQSVGGIWKGGFTTTGGVSVAGIALVTEDGKFYSEAKNLNNGCADVTTGTLTTDGSTVTGSVTVAIVSFTTTAGVQTDCVFPDGSTSGKGTVSGSVSQRSSLTLTSKVTTANGTALPSNAVTLTYDSLYSESSSLSKIAGAWMGPTGDILKISSSGAISGQDTDSGCSIAGQISIIDSTYNAYAATVTYSGCQGTAAALNTLTANGILTVDSASNPKLLYGGYSVTLQNGTTIIAVGDATGLTGPSALKYSGPTTLLIGTAVTLTPTVTGAVTSWSVQPALPAGLSIDPVTGVISGTPTAANSSTKYTITATNAGGTATTVLQLSVQEIIVSANLTALTGASEAVVAAVSNFGIAQVTASLDGTSIGTLTAPNYCGGMCLNGDTAFAFPVNASAAGSGPHTLVVQVTDGNGIVVTLTQQVVFNNPPVVTVSPGDGWIVHGSLVLSGTATSDKPGTVTTMATFDGAQILNTTGSSFSTTYNVSSISPGNYVLTITSTDVTGNATVVQETIDVASSPSLVFTPVKELGKGAYIVTADQTSYLWTPGGAIYHFVVGSTDVILQSIGTVEIDGLTISGGSVFASAGNIYQWSAAGVPTNISTIAQAAPGAELLAAHDGWLVWFNVNDSYQVYNLASAQSTLVPNPSGSIGLGNDGIAFFLAQAQVNLYYWAGVSQLDPTVANIWSWNETTGLSTRVTTDGSVDAWVQTDGIRVAWQTNPAVPGCVSSTTLACGIGLSVLDVTSGTIQSLSQTLQNFFLADGLLVWQEASLTSGAIKVSDGTTTTTLSSLLTTRLLGTGGGYVLFEDTEKLYVWSSAKGTQVLFDAIPGSPTITGHVVYFTNGTSNALYQVTLN